MIQVRNVPDEVHREAKARAAREGISLSAYVLRELSARWTCRRSKRCWRGFAVWSPSSRPFSSADLIREIRGPLSL